MRTATCTRSTSSRTLLDRSGPRTNIPIDVDEHYVAEMRDRALVLAEDPLRCQSLPHMTLAGWDLLELLMEAQAKAYPAHFDVASRRRPMALDQSAARHR